MSHLFFGLICALLSLSVLGLGPSLFLGCSRRSLGFGLAIAPAMGFAIVTVIGSYLTVLDIPVDRWAEPFLVIGASISLVLVILYDLTGGSLASAGERRAVSWCAGGFVATLALTVSPQLIGGLDYSVLRGNGSDSFNYIAGADYLDHEPFSWAQRVDPQTLVDRDQAYERARELLTTRWSTFMMLAFASRMAQVPPYIFEYCFSLLCLLIAYGPAFLCARDLGLKPGYAVMTSVAICTGFWAQVILDTRAQSQLNSIPLFLLLVLLICRIQDGYRSARTLWVDFALVSVTAVGIVFVYVEITPLVLLALVIFITTRLRSFDLRSPLVRGFGLTFVLVIIGCIPLNNMLLHFATRQFSYANSQPNTWHLAYYPWLYSNPLAGFWGFGPLEASATVLSSATAFGATLFGLALTIVLVFALLHSVMKGRTLIRMAACVALAAMVEFAYLAWRGQLWAAAKGLSFGYAFIILCFAGYCLKSTESGRLPGRQQWSKVVQAFALIFFISQSALGVARSEMAFLKQDYPHYISHHGEYRRHSWDLTNLERVLAGQQGVTVWMNLSNEWMSEYLDFALSHQVKLVNIGASLDVDLLGAKQQDRSQLPQFLIAERVVPGEPGSAIETGLAASTSELNLLRSGDGGIIIMSVTNPNGLENADGQPFFWMGGKPTVISLWSATSGCANFSAQVNLGPSSDMAYRTLILGNREGRDRAAVVVQGGTARWQVPIKTGLNDVQISIKEAAVKQLASDPRPLLLRVSGLKVEAFSCGGASN